MKVKQNDETINTFDLIRIYNSILNETLLNKDEAMKIAVKVSDRLTTLNFKIVESGFIRVLTYLQMIEDGYHTNRIKEYAPIYIDIGTLNSIDTLSLIDTNDNANIGKSPELIMKMKADIVSKQQNLRMLPEKIESAHRNGILHIHDLEYFNTRDFCADYDLRHTFYHGVAIDGTGITAAICGPAMNSTVAILHAIKVMGAGQVNSSGGQGFYNFLTFLAPYFKDLTPNEIEQEMQMFIFECNTMLVARGGQAVFSSVQLTPGVPNLWKDKPCVWKGKVDKELIYGDLDKTVRIMFKMFMKTMIKGDMVGRPFSFPKPEVNIKYEFILDEDEEILGNLTYKNLYKMAVRLSTKFGSTYYDNECTPKRHGQDGISCFQCCAYNFSVSPSKDPKFYDKMYFNTEVGFSMGGSQVVTLNNPRLAFESKDLADLKVRTEKLIKNVVIPIFHRKDKLREQMYRPFFNYPDIMRGIFDTTNLTYIIGYVGINEVVEILTGNNITNNSLGLEYLEWLNNLVNDLSLKEQMNGRNKIALSRTPAETTCMRFAKLDIAKFGDKIKPYIKGNLESNSIYYTNGSMIPPEYEESLTQKIEIESAFFKHVSGGNIFHLFLGESSPNVDGLYELIMNICTKTDIDYFDISRDLSVCKSCKHIDYSMVTECSLCHGNDLLQLARITGYIQSVDGWNDGKKQELKERKRY